MTGATAEWAGLSARLEILEAESAIRRLMADYLHAVDRGADGDTIADFFTADGVFEGLGGLAEVLGRHEGTAAIARRFDANREQLTFAAHLYGNESICAERAQAAGTWVYLQPGVYQGQAILVAGRWHNAFARVEGQWKIVRNAIEPIFIAPYSDGWSIGSTDS